MIKVNLKKCLFTIFAAGIFITGCKKIGADSSEKRVSQEEKQLTETDFRDRDSAKFSLGNVRLSVGQNAYQLFGKDSGIEEFESGFKKSIEGWPNFSKNGLPLDIDLKFVFREEKGPLDTTDENNQALKNADRKITLIILSSNKLVGAIELPNGKRVDSEFITEEILELPLAANANKEEKNKLLKTILDAYKSKLKDQIDVHLVDINQLDYYLSSAVSAATHIVAMKRIAHVKTTKYNSRLIELLESENNEDVYFAAKLLLLLEEKKAVPTIIKKLKLFQQIQSRVFEPLAYDLAHFPTDEGKAYFESLISSENPEGLQKLGKKMLEEMEKAKKNRN